LSLGAFLGMAWLAGPTILRSAVRMMRSIVIDASSHELTLSSVQGVMNRAAVDASLLLGPFLAAIVVGTLAGSLAQGGLVVSGEPLKLTFNRLNPAEALRPLITGQTPVEGLRTAFKMGLYAVIAWSALHDELGALVALGASSVSQILPGLSHIVGRVLVRMVIAGLFLALADVAWQRWRFLRDQRMTKQEMKDERKESDGDPHVKAKIRSRMQSFARRRMLDDVKKASVVVVNPTHVAVALRYEPLRMAAPTILAKGKGRIAGRIREAARKHRIPVLTDPPLARLLESVGTVGQEIPDALFRAVAGVMAWVTRRRRGEKISYHRDAALPTDLPIGPAALSAARREVRKARRSTTR
ncbi:MAG: flagellar biosynthesis protein FlhB, partial [Acidobacteriota bacterium]